MPIRAAEAYAWHARDGALQRLAPPGLQILWQRGPFETRQLALRPGRWQPTWEIQHSTAAPGLQFVDQLVRGPLPRWRHQHDFVATGEHTCQLVDRIEWELPLPPLGRWLARWWLERLLEGMFVDRHRTTRDDLLQHARWSHVPRKTVVLAGASGLVGTALAAYLSTAGHRVRRLVRRPVQCDGEVQWDPQRGAVDLEALRDADAVVNLAGESVAGGRWTAARQAAIVQSRLATTGTLAKALAALGDRPRALINASASGYYGDAGEGECFETSPAGKGFLADVCRQWEAATAPAEAAGVRVVRLRIGVVLSERGGMLAQLLPVFRAGLGGPVGTGRQYLPWIALQDLLGIAEAALCDERWRGPVHAVAPQAVRQGEFAAALGRTLRRPAVLPVPALAVRLAFGQMGQEVLLAGARLSAGKLQELEFIHQYPELDGALAAMVGSR
ncbi:MAG: TIGR01777 family protein [Deltaproteobacteria bacterium]|nr:TIGR01777 family protein [Deltaproteobacteria bacterium]